MRDPGARHALAVPPAPDPATLAWSTPGAALLAARRGPWRLARSRRAFLSWPAHRDHRPVAPSGPAHRCHPGADRPGDARRGRARPVPGPGARLGPIPWEVGPILLTWVVLLRFAPQMGRPGRVRRHPRGGRHRRRPARRRARVAPAAPGLDDARRLPGPSCSASRCPAVHRDDGRAERARRRDHDLHGTRCRGARRWPSPGSAPRPRARRARINLAAITASMAASPDADPDPAAAGWRRAPRAGPIGAGLASSAALTTFVSAAPPTWSAPWPAALLDAFGVAGGCPSAAEGRERRDHFVVAASGLTFRGIGAAFWALVLAFSFAPSSWPECDRARQRFKVSYREHEDSHGYVRQRGRRGYPMRVLMLAPPVPARTAGRADRRQVQGAAHFQRRHLPR